VAKTRRGAEQHRTPARPDRQRAGKAYKFRDRLTERERLLAEATYYHLGPGRDRRRAIDAYKSVLEIDPTETAAGNNLASIYSGRREFARAESLYKRVIQAGRASQQQYINLVSVLFNEGKIPEAERTLTEMRQRFPNVVAGTMGQATFYYRRGQLDSMDALYKQVAAGDNVIAKLNGIGGQIQLNMMRGRLREAYRLVQDARKLTVALGQPANPLNDSLQASWIDLMIFNDTARAVRRVDRMLAATSARPSPSANRPYRGLATFYALARQPQRARALLAQDDADMPDSTTRRIQAPGRHGVLGAIAIGEGHPLDAVREFWRADTTYDGPDGNCSICVLDDLGGPGELRAFPIRPFFIGRSISTRRTTDAKGWTRSRLPSCTSRWASCTNRKATC